MMADKTCDSELLIEYVLASSAARWLGLHRSFFLNNKQSLNNKILIAKQCGMTFVKLPEEIIRLNKEGYIPFKINDDKDELSATFTFQITNKTKIGFYL